MGEAKHWRPLTGVDIALFPIDVGP